MKFTVVGAGYVGISNAVMLSTKYDVTIFDTNQERVRLILNKKSTVEDAGVTHFMENHELKLTATTEKAEAYSKADYVLIATPTDYDPDLNYFSTNSVDTVIGEVRNANPEAVIVVKSTIPVGYCRDIKTSLGIPDDKLLFAPEFLREGRALSDCLRPSRVVIGGVRSVALEFSSLLNSVTDESDNNYRTLLTDTTSAEAIKLFANTYLAMRVAFFNELDTYAEINNLSSEDIITGVSLDQRIGDFYNNPSFGYGGYCLPKDTKQLKANFRGIPENLVSAIVDSNETRKKFIAHSIMSRKPKVVGVYRLTMKSGSDNFRNSSVQDVMDILAKNDVEIIVYEPSLSDENYRFPIVNSLTEFIARSDVIVANRFTEELVEVSGKVFTRDIFGGD